MVIHVHHELPTSTNGAQKNGCRQRWLVARWHLAWVKRPMRFVFAEGGAPRAARPGAKRYQWIEVPPLRPYIETRRHEVSVLSKEVFDLFREAVVHRHASTSHAPLVQQRHPERIECDCRRTGDRMIVIPKCI